MKTKQKYTAGFREQALSKVLQRGSRTIGSVADELGVNMLTLKTWMKKAAPAAPAEAGVQTRRPSDWSPQERLQALQQSYGLDGEALNAWCRRQGLFAHHLTQWREQFCTAGVSAQAQPGAREVRELKQANEQLQRELGRKEKALAEAAALLVLQKKCRALFGEGA